MPPKPKGFSRLKKDHAGHIDVGDILSTNTDALLVSVLWHSAKLGAYFAVGTNRARSAVQFYCKHGDETVKLWANTPEEAVQHLAELSEILVETCVEAGLIQKPAKL